MVFNLSCILILFQRGGRTPAVLGRCFCLVEPFFFAQSRSKDVIGSHFSLRKKIRPLFRLDKILFTNFTWQQLDIGLFVVTAFFGPVLDEPLSKQYQPDLLRPL